MNRYLPYVGIALGVYSAMSLLAPKAHARPRVKAGYQELVALTGKVDRYIPGFSKFAQGAAYRESRGNIQTVNEADAGAACRGYDNNKQRYGSNPYGADAFCWGSGGWWGLIPSTALAAPGFELRNPYLIFDPEASTALFADFVRRVVRGWWHKIPEEHRNWLTIRRFMAGNTVGLDWREEKVLKSDKDGVPRSIKVRKKFEHDLKKRGISPNFMYQRVRVQDWPGAMALWQQLEGSV